MPLRILKALLALTFFFMPVISLQAQEVVPSHAFTGEELQSLQGTIEQAEQQAARPGPGTPAISPDLVLQADFDNGSTIYDNACVACHGETGQGGQGAGPALANNLSLSEIMLVINDGRNTMPGFDVFTQQQLVDISSFVAERLQQ
jgi:mono/diheme cytochrome c family protein